MYQAYKRSSVDERHGEVEKCGMQWDGGDYLPEERRNGTLPVWMCIDLYDVEAKPITDVLEGFESMFDEVGGDWMLNE